MFRRSFLRITRLFNQNITNLISTGSIQFKPLSTTLLPHRVKLFSCYSTLSTDGQGIPQEVVNLSIDEYHIKSDQFLENILDQIELLSEKYPEIIVDIELLQGVMTISIPQLGTYIINKQISNKQIWLSSPVSGPNRFDLYKTEWISLRNNRKLLEILSEELNQVIVEKNVDLHP